MDNNTQNVPQEIQQNFQQGLRQLEARKQGLPIWVWILIVVVILIILWALFMRRDNSIVVV